MGIMQMLMSGGAAGPIDPREHFGVKTWTGNGSTQSITGLGFSPDFLWIKCRNTAYDHRVFDTIRGYDERLGPNISDGAYADTSLTSFDPDGFSLSSSTTTNGSGKTQVAWAWNAGGSTVTNNDGNSTANVRANPAAGFSIVQFTVPSGDDLKSYGHGLGAEPSLIITKRTDSSGSWTSFTDVTGSNQYLTLNGVNGINSAGVQFAKSDSTFSLFNSHYTDAGWDMIAYCFASVEGYSKFGKYTGTYPSGGHSVTCGFEPTFLMIKRLDNGTTGSTYGGWMMMDNARTGTNDQLFANCASAEGSRGNCSSTADLRGSVSFTSTGFDVSGGYYETNDAVDYLYAAFA